MCAKFVKQITSLCPWRDERFDLIIASTQPNGDETIIPSNRYAWRDGENNFDGLV